MDRQQVLSLKLPSYYLQFSDQPPRVPDGTCVTATTTSAEMTSTEPVFAQPGPVSYGDSVSHSLPVSSASYVPPEPAEEGELSDLEDQPDVDARL